MFRKLTLIFLVSFSLLQGYELPDQFLVEQHWFSTTNTFTIKTEEETLGTVHRRLLSLMANYDFYDPEENLVASAEQHFLSFGATFDITSAEGDSLGQVVETIFTFFPTFEIVSPLGKSLALAEMNIWGTSYTICDKEDGHLIALMERDFLRFKDDWTVTILDHSAFGRGKIDPKLMILLAAFQSDLDYWAAQQQPDYNNS